MTATEVLDNLRERGVKVWIEAGQVQMNPASVVTEDDLAAVKAVKRDIIRILTPPAHGSAAWPMVVHGSRLTGCPWDGCGGRVVAHKEVHMCLKCRTWFKLIAKEGLYE